MVLKACFSNGQAIIYKKTGEIVFQAPAKDAKEGQIRCLDNPDTKATLFDALQVFKLPKIEWGPAPESFNTQVIEVEHIFRDVPYKMTAEEFEEKCKRLILDLEESDIQIQAENAKHKDEMTTLKQKQEEIKNLLYEARRGNLKTTVECKIVMDYAKSMKFVTRIDNGEIIEELEMTAEEKQINAFDKKVKR